MKKTIFLIIIILSTFLTSCIDKEQLDEISVKTSEKFENLSIKANNIYQGWQCGDKICETADGETQDNCPTDCNLTEVKE